MTSDDARAIVLRCLDEIAPGAGVYRLAAGADLRDALDLDSMDVFNVVAAISEQTGVDIPDRDIAGLTTVEAFVDHLVSAQVPR